MKDEMPLLVDTGRGLTIKWKGLYLASSRAPEESAIRKVKSYKLNASTLYIIPRPLFSYGMQHLYETLPENSFLLLIEPSEAIMAMTGKYFPLHLDKKRCRYVRSIHAEAIIHLIKDLGLWRFRKCELIEINAPWREDSFFTDLKKTFQVELNRYWKNRLILIELGDRWIHNLIQNIKDAKPRALPQWQGPLLICGAGPSLEKCLKEIKKYRDCFRILAVDTALPSLTSRGIKVDGVINLDGQFYNMLDFYHQDDNYLLFSDLTSYAASSRGKNNFFYYTPFTQSEFLEDVQEELQLTEVPAMGSVGLTALHIALQINQGPLILCGLDFSYQLGDSHSKGGIFHQHYLNNQNRLKPDGDLTLSSLKRSPSRLMKNRYTDGLLLSYRQQLQECLKEINTKVYQWNPFYPLENLEILDANSFFKAPPGVSEISSTEQSLERNGTTPQIIEKMQEELDEIIGLWDLFQQGENNKPTLLKKLQRMDYLYLASPFNPPRPQGSPKELTMLIKRARKLNIFLQKYYSPSSVRSTERKAD
jgi:hypothetical protein